MIGFGITELQIACRSCAVGQ